MPTPCPTCQLVLASGVASAVCLCLVSVFAFALFWPQPPSIRCDRRRRCVPVVAASAWAGRGASGCVYKAVHMPTLRLVAVKVIPVFEQDKRRQMIKELRALYSNLVPLDKDKAAASSTSGVPNTSVCPCRRPDHAHRHTRWHPSRPFEVSP